jgi:N-acetylglucosamine-6-phosphate deacetylase
VDIVNAHLVTEGIERGWLRVEAGRIAGFGVGSPPVPSGRVIDAEGGYLGPGFIDLHVHGGDGVSVMDGGDALAHLARFKAAHGCTAFLPTSWSAPDLTPFLAGVRAALDAPGACILGAHLEGPYLNPKRAGAQAHIRPVNLDEARGWLESGLVRLMALAPELPGADDLLALCAEYGVLVAAAHTDATYDDLRRAGSLALTTHTFNAMRGLHHREPGAVGAALTLDHLTCEIIADGVHVHPAVVALLLRLKGPGNVVLVTDAVRGAGLPDGTRTRQDGRPVVVRDGAARLADGTLAGSTLTMDAALRNLIAFTGLPLADAWRCASTTPARLLRFDAGRIANGLRADLVLLDADLHVRWTMIGGIRPNEL